MQYWPALQIINQVAGEVGLAKVQTLFAPDDQNTAVQSNQLLAALNSAGNELGFYYPWEQFRNEWVFGRLLPIRAPMTSRPGWSYFVDQTRWDLHEPLASAWPQVGSGVGVAQGWPAGLLPPHALPGDEQQAGGDNQPGIQQPVHPDYVVR